MQPRPTATAFTLLEVLVVVTLIGVLGGMIVVSFSSNAATQLHAAAAVLGGELDYARTLAVANADRYKITFDVTNNRWTLRHSGPNTSLDNLPITPFHLPNHPPTEQTVELSQLPNVGGGVRLHEVWRLAAMPLAATEIEFTPLGGTTQSEPTVVWLTAGRGAKAKFIAVRVNPVTGLFWVENYRHGAPTAADYNLSNLANPLPLAP